MHLDEAENANKVLTYDNFDIYVFCWNTMFMVS